MGAIEDVLSKATEVDGIPAVAAAYATRSGAQFCGASGKRCVASGDALGPDTIFRVASMTKAITSVAALQQVEAGRVALDDDMAKHLPELAERQLLEGFDTDGRPRLRAVATPITLRQLLTHTAGFGYPFFNPDLLRYTEEGFVSDVFEYTEGFLAAPLIRDPGSAWEYGINTDWVGQLVERLSGQRLGDYFQREIFEPLGMVDTGFDVPADKAKRLVTLHHREPGGTLVEDDDVAPDLVGFQMGGGGLYATAGDYLRFLQALLGGGELEGARIMSSGMVAEASRDQIAPLRVGVLKSAAPDASNDAAFLEGGGHGLAFAVCPDALATGRSAGSVAWAGLFNSYYWIDATRGVTGVFLSQILPFCDEKALAANDAFETAVYAAI